MPGRSRSAGQTKQQVLQRVTVVIDKRRRGRVFVVGPMECAVLANRALCIPIRANPAGLPIGKRFLPFDVLPDIEVAPKRQLTV